MRRSLIGLLLTATALTGCGGGGGGGGGNSTPTPPAPAPPPAGLGAPLIVPADALNGWATADLDDATADALRDLAGDVEAALPLVDGLAIAHRGELVMDLTFRTATDEADRRAGNLEPRLHAAFSVTKSITALLIGIAMGEGDAPADLGTPYLPLLPIGPVANPSEWKDAITVEHVLSMRLGLAWNEWDPPYASPDNQLVRFLETEQDFTQALFDLPMAAAPGTTFAYNTVATTSLGDMLEHAQPLALEDYLGTYLLQPLDIARYDTFRTPAGQPDLGRGLFLESRDLLKFGQLLLDDGSWRGRQVVPAAWLTEMLTSRTPRRWPDPAAHRWQVSGYALLWWLGTMSHAGTDYQAVAGRGFGDQLLMVFPALDLVVAFNSAHYQQASREDELFELIGERILPLFADP